MELSLKYRVVSKKRIYLSDQEELVKIGIPDVSVTTQSQIILTTTRGESRQYPRVVQKVGWEAPG